MPRLRDRPTSDLLVIFLAGILGVLVVAIIALVVYSEIRYPGESPISLVRELATAASSLTAAIIGYVAGRGAGKSPPPD